MAIRTIRRIKTSLYSKGSFVIIESHLKFQFPNNCYKSYMLKELVEEGIVKRKLKDYFSKMVEHEKHPILFLMSYVSVGSTGIQIFTITIRLTLSALTPIWQLSPFQLEQKSLVSLLLSRNQRTQKSRNVVQKCGPISDVISKLDEKDNLVVGMKFTTLETHDRSCGRYVGLNHMGVYDIRLKPTDIEYDTKDLGEEYFGIYVGEEARLIVLALCSIPIMQEQV